MDVKRNGSEALTRMGKGGIWSNEWIRRPNGVPGECNTICKGVEYNFARMLLMVNKYYKIGTANQHHLLPEQAKTLKNTGIQGIKDIIQKKMC